MASDLGADLPEHLTVARRAQRALLAARAAGKQDAVAGVLLTAIAELEQELIAVRHEIGETHSTRFASDGRRPVVDDDLL
ncbi:hypothetical protein [Naasia sp. SYSU D00057]|uniref:hypothetical protein n=1 Tax=Naasia sp. SYSU D00057 TaxID=2817380 RepID=UPI001B3030DA|nr:hypothetical protein [Naasia sp. SYSU D00057]